MKTFLCGAGLALFSLWHPVAAQEARCAATGCNTPIYLLQSTSDERAYGVLATLPADAPCAAARFVVLDMTNRPLGESGLLMPGEQGRVRLGRGFAIGVHPLRMYVSGCEAVPVLVRRITLNKASPDHGWRSVPVPDAGLGHGQPVSSASGTSS
jgi:hypothetical protein